MEPQQIIPKFLQPILEELQTLEPLFHAACADASADKFAQLVAPQFWEIGASGKRYSRAFALNTLFERQEPVDATTWQTDGWHLSEAGTDNYLLTYTLHQPGRITRRLSVWQRAQTGWQVIYHQGTAVQTHGQ